MVRWWMTGLCVAMTAHACADEPLGVEVGRRIAATHGAAVVAVSGVMKVDFGDRAGRDEKIEALGTVIDPCGLCVVPLNALDQGDRISAVIRGRGSEAKPTVTLGDVKIILADGTEIPARMVLKDPDLDLGFVLPDPNGTAERRTFAHVSMTGAKTVEVFEPLVLMGRMDKDAGREVALVLAYVTSVLKKPRTLYYVRGAIPGSVAFGLDGQVVGLVVTRMDKDTGDLRPVVLPGAAVAKAMAQVPHGP